MAKAVNSYNLSTLRMPQSVVISWSGGKDSAWTLYSLLRQPAKYRIAGLLTTLNQRVNRVAIHGVRRELLQVQAQALGLPLWTIPLPSPCTNVEYESRMSNALHFLRRLGVEAIAFGDLYLQDIRRYREERFGACGLELLFPVWDLPTAQLAKDLLDTGFRARLSCVDPRCVPAEWAGRDFDWQLLAELPPAVDPCAENGEFHTYVYSGPIFKQAIEIATGEIVERDGFVFADLLLTNPRESA